MKLERIFCVDKKRTIAYEVLLSDMAGINKEKIFMAMDEEGDLAIFLSHLNSLKEMWERKALPSPPMFFINIKPSTLVFFKELILKEVQSCPFAVVLEVREDWIPDKHLETIATLRNGGRVLISLDDFGRHSSNLDRYVKLKPDFVKLELELFKSLPLSSFTLFVNTLKEIWNSTIIVEKVETLEDVNLAIEVGLSLMQGYYFKNGHGA